MENKAKLTIENVVCVLDREAPPENQNDWWKAQAEQLKPDNEEDLRRFVVLREMAWRGVTAVEAAVMKELIGDNILTPSLVTKGWMFWKQPLLTESEKKSLEAAVSRYTKSLTEQTKSLKDKFDKLPQVDNFTGILISSSLFDLQLSCMQQLSSDLKEILLKG